MEIDYSAIANDKARLERTATNSIRTLANLYAERSHFVFELLQNAEDAIRRRDSNWSGSRTVSFVLTADCIRVSHYGAPFTDADVRSICSVGETTKDITDIGRFGIGFKSVYAFTDRPEVHSGSEDFAIESFVKPVSAASIARDLEETVLVLPLRTQDASARTEITHGLQKLGPRTLLFLHQIEEIAWAVEDGPSGLYMRSKPEVLGNNVRLIRLIGETKGQPTVEENWLVCSREAKADNGKTVGLIEIAFSVNQDPKVPERWSIQRVSNSHLSVFFPTILSTFLGFLVQGPYRTTPSRDNVPRNDEWNKHLVRETSHLLVESLRNLRDLKFLDADALMSLPLDRAKFAEENMFAPLFDDVKKAFTSDSLLPTASAGHVSATKAKLARTQELRELFRPREFTWLSGDITQDRMPELRQYLMRELGVTEITPETILTTLTNAFLEAQPDSWVLKLYEFLHGQPALLRQGKFDPLPLVRLENGKHVTAKVSGQPQVFLPSPIKTGFPTVKPSVCATDDALELLVGMGLTKPDAVDDVVRNVLPRYTVEEVDVTSEQYEADIGRILTAFATDSKAQREKLVAALKATTFVMSVDAGDSSAWESKPGDVYLATERLKELFSGVAGILLVDDSYSCLRGEGVRDLLEACGAQRYLLPKRVESKLTGPELCELRRKSGCEDYSSNGPVEDHTLRGLDELLNALSTFDPVTRMKKAKLLWEALGDVEDRRGAGTFSGTYRWTYYHPRSATFDAAFVTVLNQSAWVPSPSGSGELQRPDFVLFESLSWKPNPFLLSKVRFKPPLLESLAKEAGIEPGILELLKKLGLTSEAQLRDRLGIEDKPKAGDTPGPGNVDDAIKDLLGGTSDPTPPITDPAGPEPTHGGAGTGATGAGGHGSTGGGEPGASGSGAGGHGRGAGTGGKPPGTASSGGKGGPGAKSSGAKPFISYVATHPDDEEPDPDGLAQEARMALEEKAIDLILAREPQLKRTPTNNPGFDLFEPNGDDEIIRRVEVKAMTGDLRGRPVGVSREQFDCARKHGEAYWLYVVECADDPQTSRIVRIQDPAGKARTFCFDRGWISVAEIDGAESDEGAPTQTLEE